MSGMAVSQKCAALVVGAGPVGLTVALELSRHGVSCRIVDSAPQPTDKSKALVLWGRSLELLENSGSVAEDFIPHGVPGRAVSIFGNNGRRLVHMPFERDDTAFPQPLMIPQCETERLLAARLAARGVRVERSVELTGLVQDDDGVTATLRHPDGRDETVSCDWLLGCDGAHSFVRKHLGLEFAGEFEPNDWILADAHIDGPIAHDEIGVHWHSDGLVAMFPIGRDRFRVVADQGLAPGTAKPADPSLAEVQALLDARGLSQLRIRDPIWLAGFRIHERKVDQYGRGRVFLAGDAAHIHSPAGGQGMNTGMQDAVNLAWKLGLVARGRGLAEPLLSSYTQERSAVGDMVLRNAGHLTKMATLRNPLLQCIRNHAFSLVGSLSAVQHRAIAALSELAVCYPGSPLSADDAGRAFSGGPACGDRLPDAEVMEIGNWEIGKGEIGKGDSQRLLGAMRGTSHYLLLLVQDGDASQAKQMLAAGRQAVESFGDAVRLLLVLPAECNGEAVAAAIAPTGPDAGDSDVTVLCDVHGQVRERLGVRHDALLLVRPDGYVNFRGGAGSWQALEEHLGTYLVPAGRTCPAK